MINYPALKMRMGTWDYYVVRMRMSDVASEIKFAHEINQEKTLDEALQRELKKSRAGTLITNYLCNQPERFFNSLVVAAFDGNPKFYAVDLKDDPRFEMLEDEFQDTFGIIRFSSSIKTFALDGQHRLFAIKKIMDNEAELPIPPGFSEETISVVYVCPPQDVTREEFLKSYRRLFSSLNRHAKSTDQRTNIIMDEDDRVAILTRRLLRENDFFKWVHDQENPTIDANATGKNINKGSNAFTNIVPFYEMNQKLLWDKDTSQQFSTLNKLIQEPPTDDEVETLFEYLERMWDAMLSTLPDLSKDPINMRQNGADGTDEKHDNVLFRPVGQLDLFIPLVRRLFDENHINKDSTVEEMLQALKPLKPVPWSLQHNLWRDFLSIYNGSSWVMRDESRSQVTNLGYTILLWLTGCEDLNSDQLDDLQEKWSALLIPLNIEREEETFTELEKIRDECLSLRS